MVKNSREAPRPGAVRALNQPVPLDVNVDGRGLPKTLKLRNRWVAVDSVADFWRIDDEWWRDQPISRMYCQCVVDQGLKITMYQDLLSGRWYWQEA